MLRKNTVLGKQILLVKKTIISHVFKIPLIQIRSKQINFLLTELHLECLHYPKYRLMLSLKSLFGISQKSKLVQTIAIGIALICHVFSYLSLVNISDKVRKNCLAFIMLKSMIYNFKMKGSLLFKRIVVLSQICIIHEPNFCISILKMQYSR